MKYNQIKFPLLLLLLLPLFMISCHTREKLVYFQNSSSDSTNISESSQFHSPVLKIDDFLSITVTSDQPELAAPFNLPTNANQSAIGGYTGGNQVLSGYLIDSDGNVRMPIIGQVQLSGKNCQEASQLIREQLKGYVTNPVVQIHIQNFKITVLGDVQSPGTFRIPNERITFMEALGLAGDLRITGDRTNVLLIREENGKKTEYRIDLTKNDILNSEVYYLQQNDVIYIEPNTTRRSESTMWRATGGIVISLTSLVISTIILITR